MKRNTSWDDLDGAVSKGPLIGFFKILPIMLVIIVTLGAAGYALGWFGEVASVAKQEFGPSAMLKKYEWFKDAAAQLEKKQADISVYDGRTKAMDDTYKGTSRQKWARDDREQYNVWMSEVAGVKASYNSLAADYNAQMAKFNWQFANVGDLPKGADKPLPREFKSYETK